jgi:hypothetical protein
MIEEEILSAKSAEVRFPFFNVYLATWLFMIKAAEIVNRRI